MDVIDESTDILGVSAVIINDLKQKRTQDYNFDWNKALDVKFVFIILLCFSNSYN